MADQKTKTPKAPPAPKPEGYTFGRPTKYLPEYCEKVVELGKLGKSLVQICSELGVTKPTLSDWCGIYPDFSSAMELARVHSQSHWEELGYDGMKGKSIDAQIWSRSMAARFPADWRETKNSEITGKDGGSIKVEQEGTANDLLASLAAAASKAAAS